MNGLPGRTATQVKTTPGVKAMTLGQIVELARTLMASADVAEMAAFPRATGRYTNQPAEVVAAAETVVKRTGAPTTMTAPRGRCRRCFRCSEEGHFVRDCPYDPPAREKLRKQDGPNEENVSANDPGL